MAADAFCPSWATPSIEFAIRLWRSPKQLKAFGVGESGVGLPTNSNGVGPITDEMRQLTAQISRE